MSSICECCQKELDENMDFRVTFNIVNSTPAKKNPMTIECRAEVLGDNIAYYTELLKQHNLGTTVQVVKLQEYQHRFSERTIAKSEFYRRKLTRIVDESILNDDGDLVYPQWISSVD